MNPVMFVVLVKPRVERDQTFYELQYPDDMKFVEGFVWKNLTPVSYLSDLSTNMAGRAGPCAFPRYHFV